MSHFSLLVGTNFSNSPTQNDKSTPPPTEKNFMSSISDPSIYSDVKFEKHSNLNRFYLEASVLPVLVPGIMKLLTLVAEDAESVQVDKNEEVKLEPSTEKRLSVSPLHFLAQYLMRYNLKHSDDLKDHPYVLKLNDYLSGQVHMVREMKEKKQVWFKERLYREKRRLTRRIQQGKIILSKDENGVIVEEELDEGARGTAFAALLQTDAKGVFHVNSDEDLDEMSYDDAFQHYKERLLRNKERREREEQERLERLERERAREEEEGLRREKEPPVEPLVKQKIASEVAKAGNDDGQSTSSQTPRSNPQQGFTNTTEQPQTRDTTDISDTSSSSTSPQVTPRTLDKEHEMLLKKELIQLEKNRDMFLKRQKVYSFGITTPDDVHAFYKKVVQDMQLLLPGQPIIHIAMQKNHKILQRDDASEDPVLQFTHTSDAAATLRGETVTLPSQTQPLVQHVWKHRECFIDDPHCSDIFDQYTTPEIKERVLSNMSRGNIVSTILTNSRRDPCGVFTVEYADRDVALSENDIAFIKKTAEALSLAQQSVHLEQSIQRVKAKARMLLNQKNVVLNQGMREIIGIIPNAYHAYAGELDTDREALVCISEFDRSEYYLQEYTSDGESEEEKYREECTKKTATGDVRAEPSIHRYIGQRLVSSPEGTFRAIKSGDPLVLDDLDYLSDDEIFGEIRTGGRRTRGAVVIPLKSQENGEVFGVISVELDQSTERGKTRMNEDNMYQLKKLSEAMSLSLHIIDTREKLKNLSVQAIEWIESTCNVTGAHFGMLRDDGALQYVSAGKHSQSIVGMKLSRGQGITFQCIESGDVLSVDDIGTEDVHFFDANEHRRRGSFLAYPIKNKKEHVIGVLVCNKLSSVFNEELLFTEEERKNILIAVKTLQATANYEAHDADESEVDGSFVLAIDQDIPKQTKIMKSEMTKTKFLKRMLYKSRREFRNLHVQNLSTVYGYSSPPRNTYRVIRAVLYLIDYTQDELRTWEECRAILAHDSEGFIQELVELDPTSSQEKSFKFKLARSNLNPLSYQTMINSSSRVALLMYSWCQICLGLRDEADMLRNKLRHGRNEDVIAEEEFEGEKRMLENEEKLLEEYSMEGIEDE